jgi:hypothetical protein
MQGSRIFICFGPSEEGEKSRGYHSRRGNGKIPVKESRARKSLFTDFKEIVKMDNNPIPPGVAGLAIGVLLTWLILRERLRAREEQVQEFRSSVQAKEEQLCQFQSETTALKMKLAELETQLRKNGKQRRRGWPCWMRPNKNYPMRSRLFRPTLCGPTTSLFSIWPG